MPLALSDFHVLLYEFLMTSRRIPREASDTSVRYVRVTPHERVTRFTGDPTVAPSARETRSSR